MQKYGRRFRWQILLVTGVGYVASLLAATNFTVAVPSLMNFFEIGQSKVQWTITGFMAAMTVGMLPTSWLLDHIGLRRLFLSVIAVLGITSIIGFFTTDFTLVVVLRVLQGAMAGVLQPLGTIAVMHLFPANERGRASGILGFGIVLAPALAPTLAGMLLDRFGWSSIFLLNVPFCLLAFGLALYWLPLPTRKEKRTFDWIGLGLLAFVSVAIIESIASMQHRESILLWTMTLFFLAVTLLTGFVIHAKRIEHPIISLSPFSDRTFAMGTLVALAYGFGLYASTYLIPVFLQRAMHLSATSAGLILLPSGLMLALSIPLGGHLADKIAPKHVTIAGLALFCLSFIFFGLITTHIQPWEVIMGSIISRVGLGLMLPALSIAAMVHLVREQIGQSAVITSYVRQVGGVMGITIAAVFVSWRESSYQDIPDGIFHAYGESFMLVAAIFTLAIIAACFMKPLPENTSPQE